MANTWPLWLINSQRLLMFLLDLQNCYIAQHLDIEAVIYVKNFLLHFWHVFCCIISFTLVGFKSGSQITNPKIYLTTELL